MRRALHRVGVARSPVSPWPMRHTVGASIWQTPGGVVDELNQINDAFLAFSHELTERVTSSPGFPNPTNPADRGLATLYDVAWTPLIQAWQKFYAENKGWVDNLWWNHAPAAESYLRQLNDIRESARRIGMTSVTPAPPQFGKSALLDPEHNLVDDAADAARKVAAIVPDAVSLATKVAIGVGGLAALILITRR